MIFQCTHIHTHNLMVYLKVGKLKGLSHTLALTMECSKKALCLLEIIYAKLVACEIQNMRCEFCCGCKVREQDCLIMDEYEAWQVYGSDAIEVVNNQHSIWYELLTLSKS